MGLIVNLYLRLFWTILRSWWLPRLDLTEPFEREFRVLPNDIDINLHMNNGRYLTVADLMIVEFFSRTGFLKALLRNKWRPVLGGSIITYRRQLKLGQRYRLRYKWVGGDDRWNYLHFQFLTRDGTLCAAGYSKDAALSHRGLVPNAMSLEAIGVSPPAKTLPGAVLSWNASEAKIIE